MDKYIDMCVDMSVDTQGLVCIYAAVFVMALRGGLAVPPPFGLREFINEGGPEMAKMCVIYKAITTKHFI